MFSFLIVALQTHMNIFWNDKKCIIVRVNPYLAMDDQRTMKKNHRDIKNAEHKLLRHPHRNLQKTVLKDLYCTRIDTRDRRKCTFPKKLLELSWNS